MKIATWNVERLKHHRLLGEILTACEDIRADILVLTETDRRIMPEFRCSCHTPPMSESTPVAYSKTENRVSIYTNYPVVRQYPTYDDRTALCVELETENGNLIIYATIIGVYGNRHASYIFDLKSQIEDIRSLISTGTAVCICGDYNCSFADNYYFTKEGRNIMQSLFSERNIKLLTASQLECIDHIAISSSFVGNALFTVEEWNLDKRLSDHKGIAVSINVNGGGNSDG